MTSEGKVTAIVLGDTGVGKTSLTMRYIKNKYSNKFESTVGGAVLYAKEVMMEGRVLTMQIWDTAGKAHFHNLAKFCYSEADCCVLVFDVTNRESFKRLDEWKDEFLITHRPRNPEDFPFVVLGNKCEMVQSLVSITEAKKWCQKDNYNITYHEVSAKEDQRVDLAFETIAKKALEQKKSKMKSAMSMHLAELQPFKLKEPKLKEPNKVKPSLCCPCFPN